MIHPHLHTNGSHNKKERKKATRAFFRVCNRATLCPNQPRLVPPLTTVEYACRRQSMLPRNCLFPELRMSVPTRVRAKSKGYSTAKDTAPDDAPDSNDNPRYRQKSSMGTPWRYKDRNLCETRGRKNEARQDAKKRRPNYQKVVTFFVFNS